MMSRGHLVFAFLSGLLIASGLGLIAMFAFFWLFLRHEYVLGTTPFVGLAVFFSPAVLVIAGGVLGVRARQDGKPLQSKRTQFGLLLFLLPLMLFSAIPPVAVLFGSLGLEVHWTASKASRYGVLMILGTTFFTSCFVGLRLLRSSGEKDDAI